MSDENPSLHVEFFTDAVENKSKTKAEGRPIYEDREFIRIKFPGDKQRVHVAPANEGYRRDPNTNEWVTYAQEFPKHYQAFKDNVEYHGEGTPLAEVPFLTDSKRKELRALNIYTAETLAGLDGAQLEKLGMGGRELKNQATAWLDKASGSADITRLAAENAGLTEQLAQLQEQVKALAGGAMPPAPAVEDAPKAEAVDTEAFDGMDDADIKAFIKERTGAAPRGNPSRETLVTMATEVVNGASEAA